MLLSMTGYGRATGEFNQKNITAEIRSLNSKFTDVRIKIPPNYREKDSIIRKMISEKMERGKIEFALEITSLAGEDYGGLNIPLFKQYAKLLNDLADELSLQKGDLLQTVIRLPNVVVTDVEGIEEEEWEHTQTIFKEAFEKFDAFRLAEGEAMEKDLISRVNRIQDLLITVNPFEEERIKSFRQRIYQTLEDHLKKENIDENRFEQEIIFYMEKIDITEEKVRLTQHCKYFLEELETPAMAKGRKLNFISQEIGREINTIGAKAYSSGIQRIVVEMKDELEKVKELVANTV